MAQSRLEKIGTIYQRVSSLIKAGAMKEETRPFWLDIYKAFPPKYEPRYDRPQSTVPIKKIFYAEDRLRAKFHKEYKHFSMVNLANDRIVSRTEQFIIIYQNLQKAGVSEEELYNKAIEEFVSKHNLERSQKEAKAKETQTQQTRKPRQVVQTDQLFKDIELSDKNKTIKASEETELSAEEKEKYKPIRLSMDKILEVMKTDEKKPE